MQRPKVTVLMSVYNGEKYLHDAIDSILDQTFKDFEFLIINDGSRDRTAEILQSYHDPRIKIINNQKNLGLTKSLNIGIKRARGEYIARQDADDISLPERLERMVGFLDKNRDVGVLGSSYIEIDEPGKEFVTCLLATDDKEIRKKLLLGNHLGFEIFRKTVIEEVGFYREEFRYAQDYDIALRIAEISKVANIREPLYKHRIGAQSITVAKKAKQDRYAELAKELARERKQFGKDSLQTSNKEKIENILSNITSKTRNELTNGYYSWGRWLYLSGNYTSALKFLIRLFPHNLFNKRIWLLILKSIIKLIIPKKILVHLEKKNLNKCQK